MTDIEEHKSPWAKTQPRNEIGNNFIPVHGLSRSAEYDIYISMKDRCYNSHRRSYRNYGGRGISVCDRWLEGFTNFYADMGPRPSGSYTLDRIDNDGNYGPSNCRWATPDQQSSNNRRNKFIEFEGDRLTVAQWERKRGWNRNTVYFRLKSGMSIADALTKSTERKRRGICMICGEPMNAKGLCLKHYTLTVNAIRRVNSATGLRLTL